MDEAFDSLWIPPHQDSAFFYTGRLPRAGKLSPHHTTFHGHSRFLQRAYLFQVEPSMTVPGRLGYQRLKPLYEGIKLRKEGEAVTVTAVYEYRLPRWLPARWLLLSGMVMLVIAVL